MGLGEYVTRTPALFPGMTFWLDATHPTNSTTWPANNTALSTMIDLSGNKFDIIQNTASKQPLFQTNIQAGLPGIYFDGVDDGMYTSTTSTLLDPQLGHMTIFVVCSQPSNSGYYLGKGAVNNTSGVAGWAVVASSSTGRQRAGTSNPTSLGDSNAIPVQSGASIKEFVFTGSTLDYLLDGASNGSQKSYGVSITRPLMEFQIGGRVVSSNDLYIMFYFHEIIIYKSQLTSAQRLTIRRYLGRKWGISVV